MVVSLSDMVFAEPGGFLQWEEVDNTSCTVLTPDGDKAPALEQVLGQLASSGE